MARTDHASARRQDGVVGRAVQLAALADVLDQVVDGDSRLVLVGGEAGSGKTTLVDAF